MEQLPPAATSDAGERSAATRATTTQRHAPAGVPDALAGEHAVGQDGSAIADDGRAQLEAERNAALERERAAVRRLDEVLASMNDAFFTVDRAWRCTSINSAGERFLRRPAVEALGRNIWELYPDAVDSAFYHAYHQAMDERTPATFEEYYAPLDLWVEERVFPTDEGIAIYARDISAHKRLEHEAEERAREAAAHAAELEAVFDAIADGVYVYDPDGRLIQTNAAAQALNPLTTSPEYLARPLAERIAPLIALDERGEPLAFEQLPLARVLRGETLAGMRMSDTIMRTPDGREVFLSTTGAPVRDAEGRVRAAVIVTREVTERRRLEREVATRAAELQAVFDVLPVGVGLVHADGRIYMINDALRAIWGQRTPLAQAVGEYDIYKAWWPGTNTSLAATDWSMARALAMGETYSGEELRIETFDGAQKTILSSAAPIRDASGAIAGGAFAVVDITARKTLEQQNRAALRVLLQIAQLVTEPGLTADPARLLSRVAASLSELDAADFAHAFLLDEQTGKLEPLGMYGAPVTDDIRAGWEERVRSFEAGQTPQARDALARLRRGEALAQQFVSGEASPIVTPDAVEALHVRAGLTAPVLVGGRLVGVLTLGRTRAPERGDSGDMFFAPWDEELLLGVGRLAGEALAQARLATQLTATEAARLAAEEATRQRDEFLSIASHELRTPLTSAQANVQLARRRLRRMQGTHVTDAAGEVNEQVAGLLERAERQMARQNRLVQDLLDVSRIQSGRLDLRAEPMDLLAVVRESVEEQRLGRPERAITLATPKRAVPVVADADRIGQVVTNYLTNALKYSPETAPVAVRVTSASGVARVSVQDGGEGIPPEELERIWTRFHRIPGVSVQSGSAVGLGLGLYIAREIVERHGGQVGVERAPGGGAIFWFTLPLA